MNTLGDHAGSTVTYVLGHSDQELERLAVQARLIDPITRRYFRDAGIIAGMRVLDVGSGAGDVTLLAADLVGDTGEVVGVDRAPAALVAARRQADALSLHNVSFRDGDPADMTFEQPFDAVIGRYVLQFQHDPATMLRKLVAHMRPGGVVVFHEPDWDSARSFPLTRHKLLYCTVDGIGVLHLFIRAKPVVHSRYGWHIHPAMSEFIGC